MRRAPLGDEQAPGGRDALEVERWPGEEDQTVDAGRGEARAFGSLARQPALVDLRENRQQEGFTLAAGAGACVVSDRDQLLEPRVRGTRVDAVADPARDLRHLDAERRDH